MEKSKTKVKSFFQKFHIKALFIILSVYLVLVTILYFVLRWQNVLNDQDEYYSYLDVLIYNILTIAGNDYFFDSVNASRIIGIIFLLFSMGVLSLITGYISSSMVERKLNPERVVKKMQNMKNHIIILGYKNDLKSLQSFNKSFRLQSLFSGVIIYSSLYFSSSSLE